jgi:hypothetical protein
VNWSHGFIAGSGYVVGCAVGYWGGWGRWGRKPKVQITIGPDFIVTESTLTLEEANRIAVAIARELRRTRHDH